MPRGVNRQYNLIAIENDFIHARIYVREMAEGGHFTRKRNAAFLEGFVKVCWQPPTDIMGRELDAQADNARRATIDAEAAFRDGRPHDAVQALSNVDVSSASHARKLMIDALLAQEDWHSLTVFLQSPNTTEEIVTLVSALVEINNFDDAQTRLDAATEVDEATRSALQDKLEARKMMRKL